MRSRIEKLGYQNLFRLLLLETLPVLFSRQVNYVVKRIKRQAPSLTPRTTSDYPLSDCRQLFKIAVGNGYGVEK